MDKEEYKDHMQRIGEGIEDLVYLHDKVRRASQGELLEHKKEIIGSYANSIKSIDGSVHILSGRLGILYDKEKQGNL